MNKHTSALGGAYVTPEIDAVQVQALEGFALSPTATFSNPQDDGSYTYSW